MPDFALPPSPDLKVMPFQIGNPWFRIGVVLIDPVSFSSYLPELLQNRVCLTECVLFSKTDELGDEQEKRETTGKQPHERREQYEKNDLPLVAGVEVD